MLYYTYFFKITAKHSHGREQDQAQFAKIQSCLLAGVFFSAGRNQQQNMVMVVEQD